MTTNKLPLMARMGIVFLTWRRYLQRQLLPHDITLKQEFVLHQLEKTPYIYPAEIADMLFCDRPTATVIINNLVKQGWASKRKDPANQKYVQIFLTAAGKDKVAELARMAPVDIDPFGSLTADEKQQLEALLRKVQLHLESNGLSPDRSDAD